VTGDLFSIEGKVALVTGGATGIGIMITRGFVEAGARVYIASRNADVGEEVAAELSKVGECHSIPANLSTEAECQRLAAALSEREPRLDILVNNAGATWGAPLDQPAQENRPGGRYGRSDDFPRIPGGRVFNWGRHPRRRRHYWTLVGTGSRRYSSVIRQLQKGM
jgi:NAD(P)-dependent dehydrogenase (short-subunit alcohol dehydrogenase family)